MYTPRPMGYRDEEDALRARNEALVSELARSEEERARLESQHRQELLQARGIVPIAPAQSRRRSPVMFATIGALVVVSLAGGLALFLVRGSDGRSGRSRPAVQSSVAPAVWHAKVKSVAGVEVAVGAECRIESALRYHTAAAVSGTAYGAATKVTCGGVILYDSQDATGNGASSTLEFDEKSKPTSQSPQARTFELDYDEQGPPSRQKPRIALSTSRGVALLTRELPALRVELVVTPGSDPASIGAE